MAHAAGRVKLYGFTIALAISLTLCASADDFRPTVYRLDVEHADSTQPESEVSDNLDEPPPRIRLRGIKWEWVGYDGYDLAPGSVEPPELILVSQGNSEYLAGDTEAAIQTWRRVISEFPNTPAWNMSILNAARVLQESGRHAEAISTIELLLNDVANYEKRNQACRPWQFQDSTKVSGPMEAYLNFWNNDWHDACLLNLESYEAIGDLYLARHFAVLASHKFTRREMCGTAAISRMFELNLRIGDLAHRLNPRVEAFFTALAAAAPQ